MKTRNWKNGKARCRAYLKRTGNGYEVGFIYGGKAIFLGNFIHSGEANQFYTLMKREITRFSNRYKVGKTFPQTWFKNFIGAHLHRCYYNFVNKHVRKHFSTANRTYTKNLRQYNRLNRRWTTKERKPSLRAA